MSDKNKVHPSIPDVLVERSTMVVTECPIGCNHDVEWPTYRHVYSEPTSADGKGVEGDCVILLPHHLIEEVWSALNQVIGNVNADGTGFTKEHFAELDQANANLDAWKHGEYEPHAYDIVELAMKPKEVYINYQAPKGSPGIGKTQTIEEKEFENSPENIAGLEREAESLG